LKITIIVELHRGYYPDDNHQYYQRRWFALPVNVDFLLAWLTKIAKTIYSVEEIGELEEQGYLEKGKIYEIVYEPKEFPVEPIIDLIRGLGESLHKEEHVAHSVVKGKKLEFSKAEWDRYLIKVMMQKVTK